MENAKWSTHLLDNHLLQSKHQTPNEQSAMDHADKDTLSVPSFRTVYSPSTGI